MLIPLDASHLFDTPVGVCGLWLAASGESKQADLESSGRDN